jgi:hypothetical protein
VAILAIDSLKQLIVKFLSVPELEDVQALMFIPLKLIMEHVLHQFSSSDFRNRKTFLNLNLNQRIQAVSENIKLILSTEYIIECLHIIVVSRGQRIGRRREGGVGSGWTSIFSILVLLVRNHY